jgi:transposase-like protein
MITHITTTKTVQAGQPARTDSHSNTPAAPGSTRPKSDRASGSRPWREGIVAAYRETGLTVKEIAEKHDISPSMVTYHARAAGCVGRKRGRRHLVEPSPAQLEILRKVNTMPLCELAKQYGCSKQHVHQLKKRWAAWVFGTQPKALQHDRQKTPKPRRAARRVILCFRVTGSEAEVIKALGGKHGHGAVTSPNIIARHLLLQTLAAA